MTPKVYICIPVYNRINYTLACLDSIFSQTYDNFHVVISDAGSADGTKEIIGDRYPSKVTMISIDSSNWWAGGMNVCIRYVLENSKNGDYLLFLNNDTELAPDCLSHLVSFSADDSYRIVGILNLFYENRSRIEPSAFINRRFFLFYYKKRLFSFGQDIPQNAEKYYPVDTLSGKGVMLPVKVFDKVGLLNEKMLPHYHSDTEFVIRCKRLGFKPILLMSARLYSHVSQTGYGTVSRSFSDFISGFFNIKSAIHIKSVFHFSKLVYGKQWFFYFLPYYCSVIFGYFKRILCRNKANYNDVLCY